MLQVLPRLLLKSLAQREPDLMTPMPGARLELRMPDGSVRHAALASFGVEAWEQDGGLVTSSDPSNPELTLNIAGDLQPQDVPVGTEIWLAEPHFRRYQPRRDAGRKH